MKHISNMPSNMLALLLVLLAPFAAPSVEAAPDACPACLVCPQDPSDCQFHIGSLYFSVLQGSDLSGLPTAMLSVANVNTTSVIEVTFALTSAVFPNGARSATYMMNAGDANNFSLSVPTSVLTTVGWTVTDRTEGDFKTGTVSINPLVAHVDPKPSFVDRALFGLGGLAVGAIGMHLIHRSRKP